MPSEPGPEGRPSDAAEGPDHESESGSDRATGAEATRKVDGRHTDRGSGAGRRKVEQTTDDTDEGWGERGDDDATGRWLRENRPPHWS